MGQGFALVVAAVIVAIVGPLFLAWLVGRQLDKRRADDFGRQSVVAARAEESARVAEQNRKVINDKLDVIHTLVNNDLTKALSGQRTALVAQLEMLEGGGGDDVSRAVEAVRNEIGVLDETLAARAKQDVIAAGQIEQTKTDEAAAAEAGG